MSLLLMGILLLLTVVTAAAGLLASVVLLNHAPLPVPLLYKVLALVAGSSAAAVYCYGWLSVHLGGPFPELCEDPNTSGAALAGTSQTYWPLRNACLYSDGSTAEHLSSAVTVLVLLLAALAVALTGAATFMSRQARRVPEKTS